MGMRNLRPYRANWHSTNSGHESVLFGLRNVRVLRIAHIQIKLFYAELQIPGLSGAQRRPANSVHIFTCRVRPKSNGSYHFSYQARTLQFSLFSLILLSIS